MLFKTPKTMKNTFLILALVALLSFFISYKTQEIRYKQAINMLMNYSESYSDISTLSEFYTTKEGQAFLELIEE